ncbi:MAG TPA: ABC transporter permease [Longimicrobiales bacterium]|nr:ABC transporter permease [Longimicrobiales bacterium]
MDGWIREMGLAVRALARQPGFSAVAVVTLALGIGANTAIFSVIDGALLRPLPYEDPDGIVYLSDGHNDFGGGGIDQSLPNLLDLRAGSRLLVSSAVFTFGSGNLATEDRPERVRILLTSSEFLDVLGISPRIGRDLTSENDVSGSAAVALLTAEAWQARFGSDPDIVGRTTTLDAAPLEVIGVLPAGFTFPGSPDLIMPLRHIGKEHPRGNRLYHAVARMAPGVQVEAVRAELQSIFAGLVEEYPDANTGWFAWADPVSDFVIGARGRSLFLFAGAVGLVLLIACVNVANLLLVRADGRSREFALRFALGGRRAALVPLFVAEGLVLSLLGGLAGIVTAYWGVDALVAFFGTAIPRSQQIHLSGTALAFGTVVSVVVGVAVGLLPILRVNQIQLLENLKEGSRGSAGRRSRLGRALVVTEVALAVLIVSGAGLLTKSVRQIQEVDLGVATPEQVMTFQISLPSARYDADGAAARFYQTLLERIEGIPGVASAATTNRLPLLGGYNTTVFPTVADPDRNARFVSIRAVTPAFFETVGVPLLSGRWLTPAEFDDPESTSVLINQTLARQLFPNEDPLGQMVGPGWAEGGLRVVGVVGDIRGRNATRPAPPAFFFSANTSDERERGLLIRSRGPDPYLLLPTIREVLADLDGDVPLYSVRTLAEIADTNLGTRRLAMSLFSVFAGLALLLGSVGIYGVMSFTVAQRFQEMGVRLALGAERRSIFALVLAGAAQLALPGIVIGLLLALASARVLSGLLYEVGTQDPATYLVVSLVLIAVAAGASFLPAYRATRVNPVDSMRDG